MGGPSPSQYPIFPGKMSDTLQSICLELLNKVKEYAAVHPNHDNDDLLNRASSLLEVRNCWLDDGVVEISALPDTCVLDEGRVHDCIYAEELVRTGKGKLDCRYWNAGRPM